MFNNTDNTILIQKLGSSIQRCDVTTGHVFKYDLSSEGYIYAHIGESRGVVFSLKLPRDTNTMGADIIPVTFASTPTSSSRQQSMVTIVGYYTLHVQLHQEASLCPLSDIEPGSSTSNKSNRVVSLRNDYDKDGRPHLYFVLGKVPERQVSNTDNTRSCVLARLTRHQSRDNNLLHVLPDSTMVADRGFVTVNMYEGRE